MPSPQPSLEASMELSNPSREESTARPALPSRDVSASTLEDAYVQFIFHCNPALPLSSDTESLREAFRNPPRSGGKVFDSFKIYQLVRQFYGKEIKTWTELTTKLGVEPPDPGKDESAQKVAQYGVRLKKWMNSMHVKSFFEYLMDISNDYWTNIPNDPDPVAHPVRDGVALEDDMALRALLPHIRPKRGRKRPEGTDIIHSPAQRPRLSPSSAIDDRRLISVGVNIGHGSTFEFPLPSDSSRLGRVTWSAADMAQTPLTRWPQSAITPTIRASFWPEASEPLSAITPKRPKLASQRRGAKNVSSAWKPGGPDAPGKTRGRPPIHRNLGELETTPAMYSAHAPGVREEVPAISQVQRPGESLDATKTFTGPDTTGPQARESAAGPQNRLLRDGPRPARPSISLKVPERQGGAVRLATPPPPIIVEEESSSASISGSTSGNSSHSTPGEEVTRDSSSFKACVVMDAGADPKASEISEYFFERMEDRTNIDGLMAYFVDTIREADWFDAEGKPAERASVEECTAIANAALENMYKKAASVPSFFVNLAGFAGARALLCARAKSTRLGKDDEYWLYNFGWEYRFGSLSAHFDMGCKVPLGMWQKEREARREKRAKTTTRDSALGLSSVEWRKKYQLLVEEMAKRERDISDLRTKMVSSLKQAAGDL